MERKAVKELQEECQQMLAEFPTTSEEDQKMLGKAALLILTLWKDCIDIRILSTFALDSNLGSKSSTF
jgi:hypothetical protein